MFPGCDTDVRHAKKAIAGVGSDECIAQPAKAFRKYPIPACNHFRRHYGARHGRRSRILPCQALWRGSHAPGVLAPGPTRRNPCAMKCSLLPNHVRPPRQGRTDRPPETGASERCTRWAPGNGMARSSAWPVACAPRRIGGAGGTYSLPVGNGLELEGFHVRVPAGGDALYRHDHIIAGTRHACRCVVRGIGG